MPPRHGPPEVGRGRRPHRMVTDRTRRAPKDAVGDQTACRLDTGLPTSAKAGARAEWSQTAHAGPPKMRSVTKPHAVSTRASPGRPGPAPAPNGHRPHTPG